MGRIDGKTAIVTGATRGIGRAIAKLFAAEGANVAILSRTAANIESVVDEITADGGVALGAPCDVSDRVQIDSAVSRVVEEFGGIDILVNNAFDPTVPYSSILELSTEQLQRNLEMGPIAYLNFMQAAHPYLKVSEQARIINFGSMAGVIGLASMGPYNMAKEAVRALTRTAAREWAADGITVNNLLPIAETWGPEVEVPAPTSALARFGQPADDIAPVALFLASTDSQFITGSSLTPDGGAMIDAAR
ncbi:SDR family NAD(P)-dependent oxidoreductase [Novosphingobium profundi]|uniref:SDR family NAD(P)-dependent oxidoreductase n=1 Tax=Novosphingobium profundi TaxID=1774954 RepID=UPI001CFD1273|nr:SDR family oxidoreductase [Novosphingobium profundi]